jgi:hypothetical protein
MGLNNNKPIFVKADNSKDFYITFFQMFKAQLQIRSMTDVNVLTSFCLSMEYNSTKVKLSTSSRKQLCNDLGIANSHLSMSIKRLKAIGLIDGEDGEYEINPFLVWKGNLTKRERLLAKDGIEIRMRFSKIAPEVPYNPFNGGSKEFDK